MAKTDIFKTASNAINKFGFKVKKHSPEILAAVGVVGTVTSAVMACKATTKVSDILEETKQQVDSVHMVLADEAIPEEKYSEEDSKKDLAIIYAQSGAKFVKLYAPAVALGAISIGCLLGSNHILRKRNVALAAAYTAVDKGFKEYRGRVVERFGQDIDRELKYGIKAKKITETVVDEETGKEKKVKKTVDVVDESIAGYSDYARFFDELNPNYEKDAEFNLMFLRAQQQYANDLLISRGHLFLNEVYDMIGVPRTKAPNYEKDAEFNLMFLRAQQQYANDLLISRGHLFLNEVYDMIGVPRTKAGQVVGWVYNPENPVGDNYVDFGMYDIHRPGAREFVNGYEKAILLDFNVDGNIWDLI